MPSDSMSVTVSTLQGDVEEFHKKFRHPVSEVVREITSVPYQVRSFRVDRINEEHGELIQALRHGDLEHTIREGVDLVYVVLGLFAILGIPFQTAWNIVHEANMQKEPAGPLDKPTKPPGWVSPDVGIAALVEQLRARRDAPEDEPKPAPVESTSLVKEDSVIDDRAAFNSLLLVTPDAELYPQVPELTMDIVSGWTPAQLRQAYEYAMACHLSASDNEEIVVPPMPDFLVKYLEVPIEGTEEKTIPAA